MDTLIRDCTFFRNAFTYAGIGMALVDLEGKFFKVNTALCKLMGYPEEDLLNLNFQTLTHPEDLIEDLEHEEKLIQGEIDSFNFDKRYLHKNGYTIWALLTCSLVKDAKGQPLYYINQIQDITKRKQLEQKLHLLATTDTLTGTLNRYSFLNRANKELRIALDLDKSFAVIFLDIDKFKLINDTYGHDFGDKVLKVLAQTCQANLRASDLLGRIGGEEFVVALMDTNLETTLEIAERLRVATENLRIAYGELEVKFTISIGVTTLRSGDQNIEPLLKRADEAMYQAKNAGRNTIKVLSDS